MLALGVALLLVPVARAQCTDMDSDGFFFEAGCGSPRDCNDAAADTFPGATETCDGYDNDCNGQLDDDPLACP